MVAVLIVASVGSFVDWKKEVQFVKSRAKSNEKNVVSKIQRFPILSHWHAFRMTLRISFRSAVVMNYLNLDFL